jgi:hypothetical protein
MSESLSEMWNRHRKKRDECASLERKFGSDWVTCSHPDNPTALSVCSYEHCPIIDSGASHKIV